MKFRWKILLSNLLLLAIAFSISGYLLVSYSFRMNREREVDSALEENQLIQISLQAELVNDIVQERYSGLDSLIEVGASVAGTFAEMRSDFVVVDQNRKFYFNTPQYSVVRWELLDNLAGDTKNYVLYRSDGKWYVECAGMLQLYNDTAYILTRRDISNVFLDRAVLLRFYMTVAAITLMVCSVILYFVALWLTMPIMHLNRTASVIASGSYFVRCVIPSDDEIGELGRTFNRMADAVENHVQELIEEGNRKEDFVGNFTHEIKTPLTSIIGYADMIRSRNLSDETRILAANYIFNEGMRLETMSMKLFDLLLLNKEEIQMVPIRVRDFFEQVSESVVPMLTQKKMHLEIRAENVYIMGEPDLLKTAFINMVDNSRKASEEGGKVRLNAYREGGNAILEVQDFGFGIPEEEVQKITQAFYMVDKSRSRESGGAGLGLALTERILKKNGGELQIRSRVGEGTTMRVVFQAVSPETREQKVQDEDEEFEEPFE